MFDNLSELPYRLLALLLCLTVHEFAHGFAAYKLGDSTAKYDGRLSLNPIRHIDPIGFFCILFLGFGWAKPVMVNPSYFEDPKKDMGLTAFAGPCSNFILAFVCMLLAFPLTYGSFFSYSAPLIYLLNFLDICVIMNISLGIFNMIPIPPLDGSKVFASVLPDRFYYFVLSNDRMMFIIMLILLWTGAFSYILMPLVRGAYYGLWFLVSKIYFFL